MTQRRKRLNLSADIKEHREAKEMKLIVEGNVKEIAELVREMQERPNGKLLLTVKPLFESRINKGIML